MVTSLVQMQSVMSKLVELSFIPFDGVVHGTPNINRRYVF